MHSTERHKGIFILWLGWGRRGRVPKVRTVRSPLMKATETMSPNGNSPPSGIMTWEAGAWHCASLRLGGRGGGGSSDGGWGRKWTLGGFGRCCGRLMLCDTACGLAVSYPSWRLGWPRSPNTFTFFANGGGGGVPTIFSRRTYQEHRGTQHFVKQPEKGQVWPQRGRLPGRRVPPLDTPSMSFPEPT